MRYLGSKSKLLTMIEEVINKNQIKGEVFGDLFAGTGCVGDYFKDKYKIISNDFMYYSFVINQAKLLNEDVPGFNNFKKKFKEDVFEWFNKLEFVSDESYFVYNHYTPIDDRKFFTERNGLKIDGIRLKIEELYKDDIFSESEYYFLLASLLESTTKVSNTTGTYEAFLKFWDNRALKDFILEPIEIKKCKIFENNEIFNEDTNQLVRNISGDIAYLDPPYTVTQYVSAYHMLETIAKYDYPNIKGIGGKRGRGNKNSLYAQKNNVRNIFEDLFRQINFKHIIISYSNQGLISIEDLVEIAKPFAIDGNVQVNYFNYKEYKNHRSSKKSEGKALNEVIIYFEKDLCFNKSPLNYSGSKDVILRDIIKELPYSVNTFVDVMGGAFNVGANIFAMDKVVYNEINKYIYDIIKMLLQENKDQLISKIENCINKFGLKKGDKESFNKLRNEYNANPSPLYLYVLHMYAFQNMIRFNNSHKFNTPIGVAGYSDDIRQRIQNFKTKTKKYELLNLDYSDINWESYPIDTVFYFDPPYFITKANYNDGKRGMKGWSSEAEAELLLTLSKLDEMGYKFILSNVIYHKDKTNHILLKWIKEHEFKIVEIGTSGWRYAKNEVLIKNF